MAVRAGRYRHRIQVMIPSTERDAYGSTVGYDVLQRPWCSVTPISESKTFLDAAISSEYTVEFEVRYSKELENPTSDMYIIFKDRIFDIVEVINVMEINERLRIKAVRRNTLPVSAN